MKKTGKKAEDYKEIEVVEDKSYEQTKKEFDSEMDQALNEEKQREAERNMDEYLLKAGSYAEMSMFYDEQRREAERIELEDKHKDIEAEKDLGM